MTRSATPSALLGHQPPVELLLHPMTLTALGIMILNDGWLRGAHPGPLTGKLSDFAAVLAYPGLLAGLWGLGAMAADGLAGIVSRRIDNDGRPDWGVDYSLRPGVLLGACTLTGVILAGINLWTPFRDGYLWLLRSLDVFGWFGPFGYTMDPTDVVALALLPVVWLVGRRLLARIPAGRLRAVHRTATRRAMRRTGQDTKAVRAAVRAVVDRELSDVRRAQGAHPPPDRVATLDALIALLVKGALREAALPVQGEPDVAFDPAEHYHRLGQALENHQHRGSSP